MNNSSKDLSKYLLQIKAIQLNVQNPFTWASGWQSPIYCDNRIILSYPQVRDFVKDQLVGIIKEKFYPEVNCIAGVATAGIPHAAMIADALGLPMVYVRSQPKGHGMKNTIEGRLPDNAKVVVIEDVVSTGKSSLKAVDDLRKVGASIVGMAAIYTYNFQLAVDRFKEENVVLHTVTNYSDAISVAVDAGYVSGEYAQTLAAWRKDPANWSIK